MNLLAPISSLIKENKAFFMILGLNIILSSGLLLFIQKAETAEYGKEIYEDFNNDCIPEDSMQLIITTQKK